MITCNSFLSVLFIFIFILLLKLHYGEKKESLNLLGMLEGGTGARKMKEKKKKFFFAVQWGLNDTGNDKFLFHL